MPLKINLSDEFITKVLEAHIWSHKYEHNTIRVDCRKLADELLIVLKTYEHNEMEIKTHRLELRIV